MARISPVTLVDNVVAALAAASAGFLAFAMPDDLFSRIVIRSRIPEFLAAAQPPFGLKARLAIISLVAIVAYAFVWALLRALDKIGSAPAGETKVVDEGETNAPRLRRADVHPDAPARRPLLAASELGEPGPEDPPGKAEHWLGGEAHAAAPAVPARPRPIPAFLVPQDEVHDPAESAPVEAVRADAGAVETGAPTFASAPPPAPAIAEPLAPSPEVDAEGEEENPDECDSEVEEQSLARLMNRFETGLSHKRQALPSDGTMPANANASEALAAERIGHRLRSAITDLNRISARGR